MLARAWRIACCVAALAWAGASASAETLEEIMAAVERQGAEIKDMSCTLKMDMNVMGQGMTMEGAMKMKTPGKMSMDGEMVMTVKGRQTTARMKMVSDGEVMYQEVRSGARTVVNRVNFAAAGMKAADVGSGMPGVSDPARAIEDLKKLMDVKVLDDEAQADGQKAWVLEGKFKPEALRIAGETGPGADPEKAKSLMSGMKIYVGQKDHIINRMDFLSAEGERTGGMAFEDVRLNQGLGDEEFRYAPPEGVAVNDVTEEVKAANEAAGKMRREGEDATAPGAEKAEAARSTALKAGAPAPALAVKTIDGETVDLAKQRGKHVLVFFWASWHKGSVAALSEADDLVKGFKGRGIELLAVSLDEPDALDDVKKLVAGKGIAGKVAMGSNEIFDAWRVARIPSYVLVDPEGRTLSSEAEPKDLDALKATLDKALAR